MAAALTRSKALRGAAECYDRAARAAYGRVPRQTREGRQLRAAARLLALTGPGPNGSGLHLAGLIAKLAALAVAVAELRQAQRHAAQAAAARAAATRLHAPLGQAGPAATWFARSHAPSAGPGHNRTVVPAHAAPGLGRPARSLASRSRPPPSRRAAGP